MTESEKQEGGVPAPGHGKMPQWLFYIWVAFLIWGAIYFVKFGLPDLKNWAGQALPTQAERPK